MRLSAAEREKVGRRGQRFYRETLRFENGVDRIESIFLRPVNGRKPLNARESG
jgi:hypothetical protein